MNGNTDFDRIAQSWLQDGPTEMPDRSLQAALDEVHVTSQRRFGAARRVIPMNGNAPRLAIAAVIGLLILVGGGIYLSNISGSGGVGDQPAATPSPVLPSPSPAPLATGSFRSHGGQIELGASGRAENVTGSMTFADVGGEDVGRFAVDLACTRTTDSGLILIGGPVTDSTNVDEYAPTGSNVAIVLQRGSPVKAFFWFEHPEPPGASCLAFLGTIPDVSDPGFESSALEPIEGTIELGP
jgi:hypothetical protein